MFDKKKNNKGFTLVELLVVIAIIGILAVVAVPALFKNIEKAKVADLEADISAIRSAVLSNYADESKPLLNNGMYWFKDENGSIRFMPGIASDEYDPVNDYDPTNDNIEGLSMPFGGGYWVNEHSATKPGKIMLDIMAPISNVAFKKLKQDLGSMVDNDSDPNNVSIILIDKNK